MKVEPMDSKAILIEGIITRLFATIVELPMQSGSGMGMTCPVTGEFVGFSTAAALTLETDVPAGVRKLASAVKAEARKVGATSLHILTPPTAMPLASVTTDHFMQPRRVSIFCDVLFEREDGSLYSPLPQATKERVEDETGRWIGETVGL